MNRDSSIHVILLANAYQIRKMGTSGLRETQDVYEQPFFLDQFTQGVADYFNEVTRSRTVAENNRTILLGGDPRRGNVRRIRRMAEILCGNGFSVVIAANGLASTPSMSHAIRHLSVAGGIILTASHNPFTDVGIKINTADGAPALDADVARIQMLQNRVREIRSIDFDEAEGSSLVERIDIIRMYADLISRIFDLSSMKEKLKKNPVAAALDPMYGAGGPFAREIFVNRLGMDCHILHEDPRDDLGGYDAAGQPLHPEPDFRYIPELIDLNSTGKYGIVAAWDSDVDRRLDGGYGFFLESADEFALFAHHSETIRLSGLFPETMYFCRSAVTADTISPMQRELASRYPSRKVETVETPTGFKWIAELGNWGVEESNGAGNPYIREKDGIFATVFLLRLMLDTGKTPGQLMEEVWGKYGRVYFTRGEVSGDSEDERDMLTRILSNSSNAQGRRYGDLVLESASSWDYHHPLSGNITEKNAAWVLQFSGGNTVKARFSGTGSGGYTLRAYLSRYDRSFNIPKSHIIRPMKDAFNLFLGEAGFPGRCEKFTDEGQPDTYSAG